MKPKFILPTALVILSLFLIVRCKSSVKNDDNAVKIFLNNFNKALESRNPDTIMLYFDIDYNKMATVFGILQGGHGSTFKTYPLFKFSLNIEDSKIEFGSSGIADVEIPVTFRHDSIASRQSILKLRLSVADANHIKIIQLNGGKFLNDYIAYENLVKSHTLTDKDIYAPITLAAFKTAVQLKSRYDSVLWFSHINQKTYYYVVKGTWNMDAFYMGKDTVKEYQMGLVGPDLKEIIPPQYDLIHNISGTFDGLIEVDKDHKHGFYDLNGKVVLPVDYDQVFPSKGGDNLAALRKGDYYYWLKNDLSVSDKVDLKINDIISNLKGVDSYTLKNDTTDNITEFNSRENHGSLRIPPSYLVDLNILPAIKMFKNPLRKNVFFEDASSLYKVSIDKKPVDENNWLTAMFYSIRDYYLGGRAEFYDAKNMIVLDKKKNKAYSYSFNTDMSEEEDGGVTSSCDEYAIRPLTDSLFEVKASTILGLSLYNDDVLAEAPYYHYLNLKNGKLVEMNTNRMFSFTKFIKMDDSYLSGCYLYNIKTPAEKYGFKDKQTDHLDNSVLRYMKNEIFADYNYKFKDTVWTNLFKERMQSYQPDNVNVDDALTDIDKYNINWINQKLKVSSSKKLAAIK